MPHVPPARVVSTRAPWASRLRAWSHPLRPAIESGVNAVIGLWPISAVMLLVLGLLIIAGQGGR